MKLKEARAKCRELAIGANTYWWPLCWTKQHGYYPAVARYPKDSNQICYVYKNGTFMYATKEDEKKHNLKGNIRTI